MKYQVRDINKTGEIEDYRIKNFAYHFILKCDGFTTDKDDLFFSEEQQMLIFKTRKCFEKWFQRISYYVKVDKLISDLIHHKEENKKAEVKTQSKVVILNKDKDLFSTAEVAAYLCVHLNTVKNLIYAKKINASKVGRKWCISKKELNRLLRQL